MLNIQLKRKCIYVLTLFCVLLSSCSNDDGDETVDPYKYLNLKSGYIDIYYQGNKIELKEIASSYYLNTDRDTLGICYIGYTDKTFLISKNSVLLFVSKNSRLERIQYNYSPPGTNYATQYENYSAKYDDALTYLERDISINKSVLKGSFKGKLFNGSGIIDIDSCKFYIER